MELAIYRVDLEDYPDPINVDRWAVWEGLSQHVDVLRLVNEATTNVNPNFLRYMNEHVFLVKENVGPGHRLPTLPDQVVVLLKRL